MRIAIVQSANDLVSGKVDLRMLEDTIAETSRPGDFWILPEVFNTGWNVDADSPEIDGDACRDFLDEMCDKYGIAICGSFYDKAWGHDGMFRNSFYACSRHSLTNGTSGKRHLFGDFEKSRVIPGDRTLSIQIDGIMFRAVICYDLRFPVWCRYSNDDPYDVLICVSQWPLQRSADRHLLLAARAMENVAYTINANGLGDSAIYLPDGKKAFGLEPGRQVGFFDIDSNVLADFRKRRRYLLDADDFQVIIK